MIKKINDFQQYGLINTKWYEDYINFIFNPNFESNYKYKVKLFNFRNLKPKIDERDYSYIGIWNIYFSK